MLKWIDRTFRLPVLALCMIATIGSAIIFLRGWFWPWGWAIAIVSFFFCFKSDTEKKGYRF